MAQTNASKAAQAAKELAEKEQAEADEAAEASIEAQAKADAEAQANKSVKVRAVFNRMRNPHTGAIFNVQKDTDVIDLNSDDNFWTRSQIEAKVLKVV